MSNSSVTTGATTTNEQQRDLVQGEGNGGRKQAIISQVKDPANRNAHSNGIIRRIVAMWYPDKDNVETFDVVD